MKVLLLAGVVAVTLLAAEAQYAGESEFKVEGYNEGSNSVNSYGADGYGSRNEATYDRENKDSYGAEGDYEKEDYSKQVYQGMFSGTCVKDGLYYNDEYTFVLCSNGNAHEQKCAPGSKNSGHGRYAPGDIYYFHDFCDVNLVNEGYNENQAQGYGNELDQGHQGYGNELDQGHQGYGNELDQGHQGYGNQVDQSQQGYGNEGEQGRQGYGTEGDQPHQGYGNEGEQDRQGYGNEVEQDRQGYGTEGDQLHQGYGSEGEQDSHSYDQRRAGYGVNQRDRSAPYNSQERQYPDLYPGAGYPFRRDYFRGYGRLPYPGMGYPGARRAYPPFGGPARFH